VVCPESGEGILEMNGKQLSGVVFSWSNQRGFGFVEAASGKRYFAHISAWQSDDEAPAAGRRVSFELRDAEKGPIAVSIRLLPYTTPGLNALASAGAAVAEQCGGAE
jgi:CspA family cold shock protein